MADLSKLVNELSALSVLEAAELRNALTDKWGLDHGRKTEQTGTGTGSVPEPDEVADTKLTQELIFDPRKITLQRFSKEETAKGKTPDFRLIIDSKLRGYCELKSPRDDWIFKFPDNTDADASGSETRRSPTSNNLVRQITSAAEQFDAVNPAHDVPNVLVLVNHAVGRTRSDLHVTLTGIPVPGGAS